MEFSTYEEVSKEREYDVELVLYSRYSVRADNGGLMTIEFRNLSNGYYSGWLTPCDDPVDDLLGSGWIPIIDSWALSDSCGPAREDDVLLTDSWEE